MLYGRLQQKWQRVQKISVLCRISAASTSVFGSHKIWVLLKSRRRLFFFRNPYVWLVPTANWFRSGRFFLSKPAWESSLIFPNRVPRTWLNQLNELSLGLLAVVVAMLPTPKKSPCFSYFLLPLKKKSSLWKAFQKHRHHCNLASKLQKDKKMVLHRVCVSKPKYLGKILHDVKEKKSGSWELQSLYLEPNQEVLKMSVTKNSKVFDWGMFSKALL